MLWLLGGLALWILMHLAPAVAPAWRARVVGALGEQAYKGLFAVIVLLGLIAIVVGWRGTTPAAVYAPPAWGRTVAWPLMFAAVLLFGAARARTNLKRVLRHPQLTGVLLWSLAHLLTNGDTRSLLLFGSLGLWALVEMPLINRRDGAWRKPEPAAVRSDAMTAAVGVVAFVALTALHPYFAGIGVFALP